MPNWQKLRRRLLARRNPLAVRSRRRSRGRQTVRLSIAPSVTENMAEGTKKGPSLRADQVQQATPGRLFWLLTNGVVRRGMPVWSKLPEPQRWQLVSYIKSLPASSPNPSAPAGERSRTRAAGRRSLCDFHPCPASNRGARIESSAPPGKHITDRQARQRSPMERPPTARRLQRGERKWQATESSKSPMRTSTRMF